MFNLLLSTFKAATQRNQALRRSGEALRSANANLHEAHLQLREQIRQCEQAKAEVVRLKARIAEESEARRQYIEERLREQQSLLLMAGRMARVGGWSLRLPDMELYWSDQVAAIHDMPAGYQPSIEEGIGFYSPESQREITAAVKACMTEGTPYDIEAQITTAAGRRVAVRAIGRAVRNDKGEIVRLEGAFQDVTERTEARERLHQLARRLTNTLETMSDAFFTLDADWRFTYLNSGAERLLHRDRAGLLGRVVWEEFPEAVDTIFEHTYRKALSTQSPATFEAFYPPLDVWLEVRAYPSPGGLAVHFSDVSERRLSAEVRREQALLLDRAKDAILVRDTEHRITYWNAAAERMYGWSRDEAIGRTVVDLIYAGDPSQFHAASAAAYQDGEWSGRLHQRTRDGRELVVDGHWTLLRNDEREPVALLSINTDATEKAELEHKLAQAQKLEAIGKLTGGIAHDFNNFLTVIIGNAELLREELADDPRLGPLAAMVQKAGERGEQLTGQLLAFARQQALDPQLVRPSTVIDGMQDLLASTLGPGIELVTAHTSALPPVLVDIAQLESALLNLCVNARDAMPNGGRLLIEGSEVSVGPSDVDVVGDLAPGDYVCIAVSDTGTGMAPDVLAQAFEPFFTTKEKGKGTGLGLSMIYGFAKQSGGGVSMDSDVRKGTTARLYLPRAAGMPQAEAATDEDGDGPHATGERILLVEDDPLVREHALNLLSSLEYDVVTASSGPEALAVLDRDAAFDLLFTDVVMPGGMNGPELAQRVRERFPAIAVLFASGYTDQAIELQDAGGGLNLLHKPYRRQALARKIRSTLLQAGRKEHA